jgi:hypothetical protein
MFLFTPVDRRALCRTRATDIPAFAHEDGRCDRDIPDTKVNDILLASTISGCRQPRTPIENYLHYPTLGGPSRHHSPGAARL